jgi:hypothetical protein
LNAEPTTRTENTMRIDRVGNGCDGMSIVKKVTLEMVRDDWEACHWEDGEAQNDAARWAEKNLPATPLDVAGWDKFSVEDRLWLLLRSEIIPERELRLLACDFAESTLNIFEREIPDDTRPRDCVAVARRFADGEATRDDLAASLSAAWSAALAASWAASWVSWSAAGAAARAASASVSWASAAPAASVASSWAASAAASGAHAGVSWSAAGALSAADAARAAEKSKQLDAVKVVLKEISK